MSHPEVTFIGYAPGIRGGIESASESGWYATRRSKSADGRTVEQRLAGPFKTASEASAVVNAIAAKESP